MIAPLLRSFLEPVVARQRRLRQYRGWAVVWAAVAVAAGVILLGAGITGWWWNGIPFVLGALALVSCLVVSVMASRWNPDYTELARRIEQHHPEVRDLLRTAVEQRAEGEFSYLQRRVIAEAVESAKAHSWVDTVPPGRLATAQALHWVALAGLVLFLFNYPRRPVAISSPLVPNQISVEVSPGDTSVERGTGLAILARFAGPLPAHVTLVVSPDAAESKTLSLVKSLDDPVFGATLAEITADTLYTVNYDGNQTRAFTIHVFDYPSLERADARLTYPDYTRLEPKRIEDIRRLSAVEGTKVDYDMQLNKPVAKARLLSREQAPIELETDPNRASVSLTNYTMSENASFELQLVDLEGRTNKFPAQFVFQALKNRTPELKLAFPRGDQRVSPIQEVQFQADVSDDFGLASAGITFRVGLTDPQTVVLSGPLKANDKTNLTFHLKLEQYSVKPDDLVSYYVWAEDTGPDGAPRRTASDMFFAEVRPFEEIFREDESQQSAGQQQGQQSQQGEATAKLLELQKQILSASWNLHRKPKGSSFKEDAGVVLQSQEQALEQAGALKEAARTEEASRLANDVESAMKEAVRELKRVAETPQALADALLHEQDAYQALLKLQAHEYRVTQSRNQSAQGQSNRNRQQLNQLELRQSENRYETESQAQAQQKPAQQEQLQVLNRLRDLARRQEDINQRVKELQTALQEAKSEEEREEIRRRLRRLREDQQQMLEDIDELRERMSRPENQTQMAQAQEQLEQTRSQAQQATESLEKGNVQEALSAGTRAERDLEKLRDDFRQKNSNQFAEDMRQMRQEARDLGATQEDIARGLENATQQERKTLTDTPERARLLEQAKQQEQGLTNLLEHMTAVTQQAETAEPLLARQLYETVRKTQQGNLDDSLRLTRELVENSFLNQARPFEQQARRELQELRRGIESAAQSVLGDDTEALRLARSELESLSNQIQQESNRAEGGADTNRTALAGGNPDSDTTNQLGRARGGSGGDTNQLGGTQEARGQSPRQGGERQAQANAQAQGNPSAQGNPDANAPGNPNAQAQAGAQGNGNAQGESGRPEQSQPGQGQAAGGQGGQGGENNAQTAQANPNEQRQAGRGERGGQPAPSRFFNQRGSDSNNGGGSGPSSGPLLGEEYRQWSDRMRNVEEMLQEPELRTEVSTVRERARAMRAEFKRHGQPPQWDLVRAEIIAPIAELQNRIQEELARRQSQQALVPIDRDPVPRAYSDLVRRYYERLGQGD